MYTKYMISLLKVAVSHVNLRFANSQYEERDSVTDWCTGQSRQTTRMLYQAEFNGRKISGNIAIVAELMSQFQDTTDALPCHIHLPVRL